MSNAKIISFIPANDNAEGEVRYALFTMIDGRAVMVACDRDGNVTGEKAA